MHRFGDLGGTCRWRCGYPQSASAIPLTFVLFKPDGTKIPGGSRLKDVEAAVRTLESDRCSSSSSAP